MFLSADSSKSDTMDVSSEIPVTTTTFAVNPGSLFASNSNLIETGASTTVFAQQNVDNISSTYSMHIPGKPSYGIFGKSPSFSFASTVAKASPFQVEAQKTSAVKFPKATELDSPITPKLSDSSDTFIHPTLVPLKQSEDFPLSSSTLCSITSKKCNENIILPKSESISQFSLSDIMTNKVDCLEQSSNVITSPHETDTAGTVRASSFSDILGNKEPLVSKIHDIFNSNGNLEKTAEKNSSFLLSGALGNKVGSYSSTESGKSFGSGFLATENETSNTKKDTAFLAAETSGNIASVTKKLSLVPSNIDHSKVEKANLFSFVEALGNQAVRDGSQETPSLTKTDMLIIEKIFSSSSTKEKETDIKKISVSKTAHDVLREEKRNAKRSSKHPTTHTPTKNEGRKLYDTSKLKKYSDLFSPKKALQEESISIKKPQRSSKRLLTPEEIQQKTSIVCKEIHSDINTKDVLSKHFSQFGDVQRVTCNKEKHHAIIKFKTHDAAALAKNNGSIVSPFVKPVDIFWPRKSSKHIEGKSTSSSSEINQELRSMMEVEVPHLLSRPLEKPATSLPLNAFTKQIHSRREAKPHENSTAPKSSKLPDPTEENLRKFLENTAQTPGEKYRILDSRDKLMRLKLEKQSDISTAKAVIGRCPDMCSEKERYSRFEKNCLSVFELRKTFDPKATIKSLEHMLIVKEYSRSSADQEEPLPHEIRPPYVLMMTMDYIMCNIANRSQDMTVSVGEWYDFIWNRTRAIRKDITQQDLCSVYCVELVEKCARFHIHCAAVLCEEDMATFDSKINDENLTKSLQTLKHLYHDLALKGVKCQNEAEFRAYDVLLSLNEGDSLRDVQTLSENIRNSPEVRLAVSAALSLSSNNYVRFFKLVLKAPYLMACIMHRYFTQVRSKAIKTLLKAYCLPNHVQQYPLHDLVSFLKFEDVSDASQFCQCLGFQTDANFVLLDKSSFAMPASSTLRARAITLVESKRNSSVGEVMNNGPLPINPLKTYEPHNSFDEQGYLKKEAFDASDQSSKVNICEKVLGITQRQPLQPAVESLEPKKPHIDHSSTENLMKEEPNPQLSCEPFPVGDSYELPKSTSTDITLQDDTGPKYSTEIMANPSNTMTGSMNNDSILCRVLSGDFVVPGVRSISSSKVQQESVGSTPVVTETYPVNPPSPRLDNKERMRFSYEVQHQLLSEVMKDFCKEIVSEEISAVETSNKIYDSCLNCIIKGLIPNICSEVLNQEVMKMAETKKKAHEAQERKEKAINDILQQLIDETVNINVYNISSSIHQELKNESLDHSSNLILSSILEAGVHKSLVLLAKEIHDKEREKWENCVKLAKRKTELLRARKVLVKWERACIARRKLEACRNTFPSNPIFVPSEKVSGSIAFESLQSIILNKNKVSHMLDAAVLYNVIKEELSWHPLDLSKLFENNFSEKLFLLPKSMLCCWKLILIIPLKENDRNWTLIANWLCAKFGKGCIKQPDLHPGTKLCSLYFLPRRFGDGLTICVRAFFVGMDDFSINLETIMKNGYLEGSSAAMLLMPQCEKDYRVKVFNHLEQLLAIKSPIPSLPLYCFLTSPKTSDDIEDSKISLNRLKSEGYVEDYKISYLDFVSDVLEASGELQKAVEWLLSKQSTMPNISHTYLKDFVEDCLIQVFNVIYHDVAQKQQQGNLQDPSAIVAFFNTVMKHWMQAASSSKLMNISWPPPEITRGEFDAVVLDFGWNSVEHLNKIKNILSGLLLPEYFGTPTSLEDLWIYLKCVVSFGCKNACSLHSSITDILNKTRYDDVGQYCIPWAEIIYECIHYLMSCQSFIDESTDKELGVNYISEELQNLDYHAEWKHFSKETKETGLLFTDGSKKRRYPISSTEEELLGNKFFKVQCESSNRMSLASARNFEHFGDRRKSLLNTSEVDAKLNVDSSFTEAVKGFQMEKKNDEIATFASLRSVKHFEAEQISAKLMKALESEKKESEAYISALECSINNDDRVDLEECSMEGDNYSKLTSSNCSVSANKSLFEPDLIERIEALNESIKAQHEANELFDKRIQTLAFITF